MVTATPDSLETSSAQQSPEEALCALFDVVEDALETLTPEKRQAWLDDLSVAAGKHEKHS
jgi:hypothetical protein